ncbi:UDP-N-acetylmuramate dehydrogenase [Vallicoccus soli]|uniref:UDP-N-acetylenolpyruvoylglucosamine reductase n=1 Tax=Vallicoccus soli TaxID=2339232 RepID=A0A3A3YQC2_9ACTN|nr:UDP-N-acetylmuramate dehydrogenase [Vallicoccus soli]RJK93433.1 UDP-N-acetylmuramate dehydrogenase [Vallicoccus soli]
MLDESAVPLATLTTLRVGGPARRLVTAETEDELVGVVRDLDAAGEPLLLLGGGSNVVVPDEGFDGTVVRVATRGVAPCVDGCSGATVTVAAGEPWDDLVARAVEEGWVGVEALSGIPGLTGATPVQNVGAYGQDVSQTVARVRTYDRDAGALRTLTAAECGFGYRSSLLKDALRGGSPRWVVLDVTFQLRLGSLGAPVAYAELARALGVAKGGRAPLGEVRRAVLGLRRGKGMVHDDADPDSWSAGSFFTNPVLDAAAAARLPEDAPRYPEADGRTKTSAAWLIERAGFAKGYGAGPARLSSRHTLALTNPGGATSADVLRLAREVRDGVRARFGVDLVPEPVLVGATL